MTQLLPDSSFVIWLTGLSGAGKSTIADILKSRCDFKGVSCIILDGDLLRTGLCSDLTFSIEDRRENIRRVTEVAALLRKCGHIVVVSLISPLEEARQNAKKIIGAENFLEVHIATPLEVCEERDPKGLYKKARSGLIENFTGIDSPYEKPENPDFTVKTTDLTPEQSAESLVSYIKSRFPERILQEL